MSGGSLWRRGVHIADLSAWLTGQRILQVSAAIEYDTQGWLALDELPEYPNTTEVSVDVLRDSPASLSSCEEFLHGEDGLASTRVIKAAIESAKIARPVVVQ